MRAALIALAALAVMPAAAAAAPPWSAPRAVTVSGLAREPAVALGGPDAAAVHADVVRRGVGLDAHLVDRAAVDADTALGDQLLSGAPRSHAGLRQDLLQSDHL